MEYVLSLSYGKDSLACLGAIEELGWQLDRIVHAEVWATDTIPADLPPMVEFKKKADEIILKRWGIEVKHVRAEKDYQTCFYLVCGQQERKAKSKCEGKIYGWPFQRGPWCNSRLKQHVLNKELKGCVHYVGIAVEETQRYHILKENKKSPLVEIGWDEAQCRKTDVKPGDPCHTLGTDTRNYVVGGFSAGQGAKAGGTIGSGVGDSGEVGLDLYNLGVTGDVAASLTTATGQGPANTGPSVLVAAFSAGQGEKAGGIGWQEECSPSLKAAASGTNMTPTVMVQQAFGLYKESEVGSACKQRDHKDATDLVVSVDCRNGYENNELSGTIQAKENGGQSLDYINHVRCANTVRRLTPLECERLQGYPDGWTDIGEWVDSKGKRHKEADSPRYKALGNSIALPFWKWLLKRISAQYERDATLGSLFDGIGGFPYCWERVNGKGTARWESEIEEFPVAVTKLRFGED